jgi:rubrerythrin
VLTMSINMERFASQGHFQAYDAYRNLASRAPIFQLQCRSCGFEPEDVVVPPKLCPKCHGEAFERFVKPGSILTNARRY